MIWWLFISVLAVCWVFKQANKPLPPDDGGEVLEDEIIICWECGGSGVLIREGDQEYPCWACREQF